MQTIIKINEKKNIFGDEIAFVEQYDFSKANLSEENRIKAITKVASICYQNPKAVGSESLYNRLLAESKGLPSSSFEFVPVLIPNDKFKYKEDIKIIPNTVHFGELIFLNKKDYLLTNYRAIVYDVENNIIDEEMLKFFNTEEECEIIKKHFKVFNYKVDLPTRSQMVRHRVSWQELSRRYVSGERVPFEFYVSEKMKNIKSLSNCYGYECTTENIIDICLDHYKQALKQGVKPQEARRIIPQAGYSQIWGGFQPTQLENYFKLRLDSHAQWEIRKTAEAMKELLGD